MFLPTHHSQALHKSITPTRLGTYLRAAGYQHDRALILYLWDRDLAVAFMSDLAILEVALRNAMSARLEARWGPHWYRNPDLPLDDRSAGMLHQAWKSLKGQQESGRMIAQCMFGFWRSLLDKGDHTGREPRRFRCDYETLWRGVLDKAFPGGKAQAQADRRRWNRKYALDIVSRINDLRNRVAHHEPLINGFPLSGQQSRHSADQAHDDLMRLAAMLDRDLHDYLRLHSKVPTLLNSRP